MGLTWEFVHDSGRLQQLGAQRDDSTWTLNFGISHDRWGNELPERAHIQIVSGPDGVVRVACGRQIDQDAFTSTERGTTDGS